VVCHVFGIASGFLATASSFATTKGLNQIVTPDLQGEGDFSLSPQALRRHSLQEDGTLSLPPECVSDQEIDYWIDKLIGELKELRSRAKRKIRNI
jgi:hypothetical protein